LLNNVLLPANSDSEWVVCDECTTKLA
jgi:hypothetical protein